MARVEIGNDKVQGIDYAYTIQGWLKGVNGDNLDKNYDQGKDAKSNSNYLTAAPDVHSKVAQDAYGFSLGYFNGDYQSITNGSINNFNSDISGITDLETYAPSLYNGNISSMVTSIYDPSTSTKLPQLAAYKYDQLNRIHSMKTLSSLTLGTNIWTGTLDDTKTPFETEYTYDANGNIEFLKRQEDAAGNMDDLEYEYDWLDVNDHEKGKYSNKLLSVTDNEPYSGSGDDFRGTSTYTYDNIGNLVEENEYIDGDDIADVVTTINWTTYGKVKSVTRAFSSSSNPPSDLEFAYDAMGNRIMKKVMPRDGADGSLLTGQETYTFYVRDAQGNIMSTYSLKLGEYNPDDLYLSEKNIYGSSRLGIQKIDEKIFDLKDLDYSTINCSFTKKLGNKFFELSNHLGNVLATVSDRKFQEDDGGGLVDYYTADICSSSDYYPFGSLMPGRNYSADSYRHGYQGSEMDNEIYNATGTSYTTFFRQHDPRLGRWLSIDPKANATPRESPFVSMGNNPICKIDPNGDTDYYNSKGRFVGTDGIDNGKNQMILKKSTAKMVKKETKKGYYISLNNNVYKSIIDIPSSNVVKEIKNAIIDSNTPSGDDKWGGYHEEGFVYGTNDNGQEEIVKAPSGPLGSPRPGEGAEIDMEPAFDEADAKGITIQGDVHIHPKGKETDYNSDGSRTIYSFDQFPSDNDINNNESYENRGSNNSIVVGAQNKIATFFNKEGQKGYTKLKSLERANKNIKKRNNQ